MKRILIAIVLLALLTSCREALREALIYKEARTAKRDLKEMYKTVAENAWQIDSLADHIEDSLLRDDISYCAMGIMDALSELGVEDALDDIIYLSDTPENDD